MTHEAIKDFQRFLAGNRPLVQDPDSDRPMTFHGLRYTRAAEWYQERSDRQKEKKQHKAQETIYSAEEIKRLMEFFQGDILKTVIRLTATYGLRRSEVCGLRWESVDFKKGTISICHTAVSQVCCGQKIGGNQCLSRS